VFQWRLGEALSKKQKIVFDFGQTRVSRFKNRFTRDTKVIMGLLESESNTNGVEVMLIELFILVGLEKLFATDA
jgi:hypothetical protein